MPGSRNFQSRVNLDKTDFKPSTLFVTHGEIGKLVARSLEQSGLPYEHLSVADFNLSSWAELDLVASFRNVVTVEEHSGEFGFGARIRSKLSNTNFHRFEIMGVPDMDFHIGGKRQFHLERSGLSESDFLNQLEKLYNA